MSGVRRGVPHLCRASLGVGPLVVLLWGCVYHNVLHNAGQLFSQAEIDRRAGRDSLAQAAYRDVVRKTGEAYRARPDADWAEGALLLLARSYLRLGEYGSAAGALGRLSVLASDPRTADEVLLYRASLDEHTGKRGTALEGVNRAMSGTLEGDALAEAHMLRGRLLLADDQVERGWWDLDRAVDLVPGLRAEAGIERLRWGLDHGERARSARALDALLADPRAGVRADTVLLLVRAAEDRWGPAVTADLLAGVDTSQWSRGDRGRMTLERARLLDASGDTASASGVALSVAQGLGLSAADARLLLADWRLERARDLSDIYALRGLLLPAGTDERVAERLAVISELETLVGVGLDQPLGFFGAAELARNRLGAHYVARGLFLAYADQAPADAWAAKALLAALDASPDEGDRAWIRGRLEAYPDSPYVLAAHGGPAAGFTALEEELDVRLRGLTRR